MRARTVELIEQNLGRLVTEDDVEKNNLRMAREDRGSGADYVRALNGIHALGRLVARFFLDFDLLLTPTMPVPPMLLGLLSPSREDGEAQWRDVIRTIAFTSVFNASGNPAASVPLHWNGDGLPIGVQFVAPYGDEAATVPDRFGAGAGCALGPSPARNPRRLTFGRCCRARDNRWPPLGQTYVTTSASGLRPMSGTVAFSSG